MSGAQLTASVCPSCALVAVPPEPIGCERCGAPAAMLGSTTVATTGRVTAHAVVHHHARPEPPTPFVVVEVALDAGPVVRSQLRDAGAEVVRLGDRVDGAVDGDGRFAFVRAA